MHIKIVEHSQRQLFIEGKWALRLDDSHTAWARFQPAPHYSFSDWTSIFTPVIIWLWQAALPNEWASVDEFPLSLLGIYTLYYENYKTYTKKMDRRVLLTLRLPVTQFWNLSVHG
jgi:hypothetical protein